jgi:hypothetical protein
MFVVQRPKGNFWHFGIRLPNGRVAHCYPGTGVTVVSMEVFAEGQEVTTQREIPFGAIPAVMQRINIALRERRPYDPARWNCEVFVNYAIGAPAISKQVQRVLNAGFWASAAVFVFGFCLIAFGGGEA